MLFLFSTLNDGATGRGVYPFSNVSKLLLSRRCRSWRQSRRKLRFADSLQQRCKTRCSLEKQGGACAFWILDTLICLKYSVNVHQLSLPGKLESFADGAGLGGDNKQNPQILR